MTVHCQGRGCSASGTSIEMRGSKGATYRLCRVLPIGWAEIGVETRTGIKIAELCPACKRDVLVELEKRCAFREPVR